MLCRCTTPVPSAKMASINVWLHYPTSGPRVGFLVRPSHVIGRDMGINLGRGDVGVPEHGLDATEVGPALEQVRGERMPQLVRRNRLGDAHLSGVSHDEFPKSLPRKRLAPRGEEKGGRASHAL